MIGLDTNILLRAATDDDRVLTPIARTLIAGLTRESPGFLNSVVLAEFAWNLARGYRYKRNEILGAIEGILRSPAYVLGDRDAVNAALSRSRDEGMSFADALIGELNRASGCETTLTFDAKAAVSSAFRSAVSAASSTP